MVKILVGDCVKSMRGMADGSVQCCVTSPPYDQMRDYDGFEWDFTATARELHRVLCAGGVLCWNINDSVVDGSETLTSCEQKIIFHSLGFRIHDTMIYAKSNFSAPEKVRYHQAFEYVFVLSKGAPRCFNPIKDRPNIWAGHPGAFGKSTKRQKDGTQKLLTRGTCAEKPIAEFGQRMNVWHGKTAGQERPCSKLDHPAQMPEWLAGDLILSWSHPGDIVLDPLAGGGTTGLMAQRYGRNAILCELNPAYAAMAEKRIADDGAKQLAALL